MEKILTVKNLVMKFSHHAVLKNINLDIEKGEKVFIIGPSGCGKSTLLKCLNHLIKPTRGDITFEGQDLKKTDINLIRTKLGLVFQSFNLFPHLTVLENIILAPTKLKLMTEEEAKQKALELLDSIKLKDKANFYPDELSGGQKQRVAIIRTLMMKPEVILFDEPTSALDPEMVREVQEMMVELANEGMTMVIVTHEVSFVKKVATKIVFMNEGRIILTGSYDEIMKSDNEMVKLFLSNIK